MSFEKFTGNRGRFQAKVSITAGGLLSLNNGCIARFVRDEHVGAVLFWDGATRRVGIQLTDDLETEGAVRFRRRKNGKGADIGAVQFLRFCDAERELCGRYDVAEEDELLVFAVGSATP